MSDYINRATKKQLQCRLRRHPFEVMGNPIEYNWNGSHKHRIFGIDLKCPRCDLEAFDVVDHEGRPIGKRKYFYEAAKGYRLEKGETAPSRDELRYWLIVLAKNKRKRIDRLDEWKQNVLLDAVDKAKAS